LLLLLLFMLFEVESSAVRLPCSDCSGGASEEQSALLTSPLQAQKLSVGTARAKPTAHILSLNNDLLCSKTVSSLCCVHLWLCSLCVCVCHQASTGSGGLRGNPRWADGVGMVQNTGPLNSPPGPRL